MSIFNVGPRASRTNKLSAIFALTIAGALALAGCTNGSAGPTPEPTSGNTGGSGNGGSTETPITPIDASIAVYPGLFLNLPSYVAQEKGMFEEVGINAEIVEIAGGPNQAAAVQSGDIDVFTFPVNSVLPLIAQGQGFKAVTNIQGPSIYTVIGTKDAVANCPTANDPYPAPMECLRDRSVGVAQLGGDSFVVFMSMLEDAGIAQSDLDLIAVGASSNLPSAFESNQIEWAIGVEPAPMMLEESMGLTTTLVSLAGGDVGDTFSPWLGETMWAMDAALSADSEKFNRLREAHILAIEWLNDPANQKEAMEIMMEFQGFDEPTARGLAERQLDMFVSKFSCAAFDNVQDYAVIKEAITDAQRMTCDDVLWAESVELRAN